MNNYLNTATYKLAESLGEQLTQRDWRLVSAESCTGGGIAQAITDIAGSSGWFDLGLVTYSNAMKQQLLNVSPQTLEQQGAVSEATVKEMVAGALARSGAHIAVATSGIAGPGGATDTKPVGTVCFGLGTAAELCAQTRHFSGDRQAVRDAAVQFALQWLLEYMKNQKNTV